MYSLGLWVDVRYWSKTLFSTTLTQLSDLQMNSMYLEFFRLKFKPFVLKFQKWTLPFLNLDLSTDANNGFSLI